MRVLTLLKFWKSNSTTSSKVAATTTTSTVGESTNIATDSTISDHLTEESDDDYIKNNDDYDDDDSYFELELTLPPITFKNEHREENKPKLNSNSNSRPRPRPKPKPQSPISVIRAASPKLRVFMFGRLAAKKSSKRSNRVEDFFEADSVSENYYFSPRRISNDSLFTVKFKIEDGSIVPKFTRSRSSTSSSNSTVFTSPKIESRNSTDSFPETSKRFSKDIVQKYLNLIIKHKSLKKNSDCERFVSFSPMRCNTTPFTAVKEKVEKQSRFIEKCKKLGKSKSASAMTGVSSPVNLPVRNDFPADGIEGAILHCKRSLKGNSSSLSRCSSDPSHEKSIQVSEEI